MDKATGSARLVPVTDDDMGPVDPEKLARGQAIRQRWHALGIRSIRELEDAAKRRGRKLPDRGVMGNAEKGIASTSPGTYDRIEAFLAELEHEMSSEREEMVEAAEVSESPDVIELTVSIGALDWSATVKGPRDMPEVLTQQLAELMKAAMREAKGD